METINDGSQEPQTLQATTETTEPEKMAGDGKIALDYFLGKPIVRVAILILIFILIIGGVYFISRPDTRIDEIDGRVKKLETGEMPTIKLQDGKEIPVIPAIVNELQSLRNDINQLKSED